MEIIRLVWLCKLWFRQLITDVTHSISETRATTRDCPYQRSNEVNRDVGAIGLIMSFKRWNINQVFIFINRVNHPIFMVYPPTIHFFIKILEPLWFSNSISWGDSCGSNQIKTFKIIFFGFISKPFQIIFCILKYVNFIPKKGNLVPYILLNLLY